jgi:hypothetical protein
MKQSTRKFIIVMLGVILFCLPFALSAQPLPGCSPDDCPIDDPFCCVPIDGGLSLLIAAGVGLGAKKAYDRRKAAIRNEE